MKAIESRTSPSKYSYPLIEPLGSSNLRAIRCPFLRTKNNLVSASLVYASIYSEASSLSVSFSPVFILMITHLLEKDDATASTVSPSYP